MLRGPRAPLWFVVLLALLEALLWRYLEAGHLAPASGPGELPAPQVAFWQLVLLVAGYVWQGIQIAGEITLKILAWSVKLLWAFAVSVSNAAVAVGKGLIFGFKQAWKFLELTYDKVLKPAWEKFWNWFDRFRGWLERTFEPLFRFLERIRKYVLDFYDKWVRPILDAIGVARKVLGVLSSLGIDWARALDRKLRELEERIEAPFRLAIGKLNEIIGIVNRVVTADGLLQRVAYIRTLERDMRFLHRAFANWRSLPLTEADFEALRLQIRTARPETKVREDFIGHVGGAGPYSSVISEQALIWRARLERR